MTIKTMTLDDYDETFSLWNKTTGMGMRSLDDSREGIGRFLERNPRTCFVCRTNKELAGVILTGHDGRRGYIYHAAVADNFRRQGIGKQLVEAAMAALDREGIKKTALLVHAHNELGNRFWEELGFTERNDLTYRNRVIDEANV
jgi:N-acetylglutamate synthase